MDDTIFYMYVRTHTVMYAILIDVCHEYPYVHMSICMRFFVLRLVRSRNVHNSRRNYDPFQKRFSDKSCFMSFVLLIVMRSIMIIIRIAVRCYHKHDFLGRSGEGGRASRAAGVAKHAKRFRGAFVILAVICAFRALSLW